MTEYLAASKTKMNIRGETKKPKKKSFASAVNRTPSEVVRMHVIADVV
jgi:hypothetical protein